MKQRGMVKWQPFASLPEQAGYIKKVLYNLNKVEKPTLSEDQLEELNWKIQAFYQNRDWINMSYFYDGYIYIVEGVIHKIEPLKQSIVIENNDRIDRFSILSIIAIQLS